jgi:hypothetical protein
MKTKIISIVSIIFGFLAGIFFTAIAINLSTGEMMVKEFKSPYDFEKTVDIVSKRINDKPGWHVTGIIDQNKEVMENGGFEIGISKSLSIAAVNILPVCFKPTIVKKWEI